MTDHMRPPSSVGVSDGGRAEPTHPSDRAGASVSLIHGDCLDVMAGMAPESVDAIVTDPPYGLTDIGRTLQMAGSRQRGFMGKAWDGTGIAFDVATWEAAYRVAKPSAYLLAFGGTRTVHRMTVALEDAGWIIRDMLVWAYASGFPKSKASLKPAWEPIVMARKPGPLRMLAVDACRIGPPLTPEEVARTGGAMGESDGRTIYGNGVRLPAGNEGGRWPANVILTDPIFDGGIEGVVGGGETASGLVRAGSLIAHDDGERRTYGDFGGMERTEPTYGDSGTYSRFFLIPKADRADREPIVDAPNGDASHVHHSALSRVHQPARANTHPTVKPTDLMRHLIRLVTPTGGTVLDPFLGSGTTALAAELEGFGWVGIEREAEYVAIAEARLNGVQRGMGLMAEVSA